MPQQLREFMLEGPGTARRRGTGWPTCCGPGFEVAADGTRTLRRVWLDTFDWRLYRAGSTLEYISGPGMHELALVTPDGERIAAEVPRMSWPRLPAAVPAGLVRERVAQIAGIRALLPVAESTSTQRNLRVLDSEDKTVVRAHTRQRPCARPSRERIPAAADDHPDTRLRRAGRPGRAAARRPAWRDRGRRIGLPVGARRQRAAGRRLQQPAWTSR